MFSQKHKGWRNPWVIGLLLIILAGVLVNLRFFLNTQEHPVRVLDDDYTVKTHEQFDAKWVQQQVERSALGWQATLHSPQQLQNDPMVSPSADKFILLSSPAEMKLELRDPDGKPVQGAEIEIKVQWPSNPKFDFKGELTESAAGHYAGSLQFPRGGNWDLVIAAQQDGRLFEMEQKVFVAIPKPD
ncbi:MAG: FixH family protein [Pseudomonadota bacterium]